MYAQFGITLDHSTYAQWDAGRHISKEDLQPGDLVFFGMGHVGLYLGHGKFIHAPHTGTVVSIDSLDSGWYAPMFSGGVRVDGSQQPIKPSSHASAHHGHDQAAGSTKDKELVQHAPREPTV